MLGKVKKSCRDPGTSRLLQGREWSEETSASTSDTDLSADRANRIHPARKLCSDRSSEEKKR